MITVLPSEDQTKLNNIFDKVYSKIEKGTDGKLFTVKINDTPVAKALVDVFDIYARIYQIDLLDTENKTITLDYIVRTVMSYALNRDIFTIMLLDKNYFSDMKVFGFYEYEDKMYLEIQKHMGC
ncbi:MAG: hypothetical protein Q4B14_05700 [Clostridia bacterium]|nr:hypothetical protein [Clostridia bacterium]